MSGEIQFLQQAFPGLTEASAEELLTMVEEKTYPPDTVLCHEGEIEHIFYLIVDGQVAITKWMEFANEERLLRHSENGDFFGEMAIISDAPRGATVKTTTETVVLEMDRESFLRLLSANPSVALAMVRTTIDRMRSNDALQYNELRQTFEALQRLDKAKLDFIEVAAHELRTPLTVVQGYAKVMELSIQDENLREAAHGLQDGVNRMLEVVNAMLDVTRIDSHTLNLSPVPVLPKLVAADALNQFQHAITERGLNITQTYESAESLPYIYADPVLMNKLFYQLISNAIKYTPDGGTIEITTRESADPRIGHGLEVIIKDSGVGINPETMKHMFERFYQGGDVTLHSSSKTAFMGGGPGLGLAIANGIVEAHQGVIWAESAGYDPDNPTGTTIHVLLPANAPDAQG